MLDLKIKIKKVVAAYLKAMDQKDEAMKKRVVSMANRLYVESHESKYNMTQVREHILFSIACGETGYYFREELKTFYKKFK